MEESLERVRAEMKGATAIIESHGQRRANMLLSDASDADIAKVDSDANLAQIRLERLELCELELQDRIADARDASERTRKAGALEAAAAAISTKTAPLDAAASAFASAYRELLSTIPADLVDTPARKPRFNVDVQSTPSDIASAIASQALAAACPQVFEDRPPQMRTWGAAVERVLLVKDIDRDGRLSPVLLGESGEQAVISTAAAATDRIIADRLRQRARAMRDSGDLAQAAE